MSVNTASLDNRGACAWCSTRWSNIYHGGACPNVKAIEYHPDGSVKRVEFHTSALGAGLEGEKL